MKERSSRIPPVRGLVPLHNSHRRPFHVRTIARWLRLNAGIYKTQKVDLLAHGELPPFFEYLVRFSQTSVDLRVDKPFGLALSLRTDAESPPPNLGRLADLGLFDLFLAVKRVDAPQIEMWLHAACEAELPVRLQVQPPFPSGFDAPAFAKKMASHEVRAANVMLADPFLPPASRLRGGDAEKNVEIMNELAAALESEGIESNLYGLPLCHVTETNRGRAGNSPLFFRDHQQYLEPSYKLAQDLYGRSEAVAGAVVTIYFARSACYPSDSDNRLARWLVTQRPSLYAALRFLRKLSGVIYASIRRAPPPSEAGEGYATPPATAPAKQDHALPLVCRPCAMRRVCDNKSRSFRRLLSGLSVNTVEGEEIASPVALVQEQPKYYDAIDSIRRAGDAEYEALAKEANEVVMNPGSQTIRDREGVLREWAYHEMMPKSLRWHFLGPGELYCLPFPWVTAPVTVAATFGGGIADYVGFSIGRAIRIMCFMDSFGHRLALHVAADGRYVLLRDGEPVPPAEFLGPSQAPARLPTVLHIGLSMWNVDEAISVQNMCIWHGDADSGGATKTRPPKVSIVVVSTRFTRRLQAVLRSIAHQEGIAREDIEVVVGYAPGVDATDDVITSMEFAYPGLRIVRSAFPPQRAKAKGLIINESADRASGEWVIVLDSDILLAPDMLAMVAALDSNCSFAGPVGRKMLPPDVTAKILLGEIAPWEQWDALLEGPGEDRYKEGQVIVEAGRPLPIGFCQCVRRRCFETIRYKEYEHFEGADWEFSVAAEENFGPVTWLERRVLHLDHGGSQWFGAQGHL